MGRKSSRFVIVYSPICCSLIKTWQMKEVTETNSNGPTLLRELGVSQASAIVVGTIIGSGIFLVPAEMMQAVGSAQLVYLAWIVGGALSMAGAITYAELGAMKPQAGGEYVYIRDAYGPLPGFLYAWTWFAIAKPGSIATIATGIVRILGTFPALAFFNEAAVQAPFVISYGQLVAITAAVVITWLNYVGVKRAGEFQLVFTVLKVVMIVVRRRDRIHCGQRHVAEFQHAFCGSDRWYCGIHGSTGGGAVGLRRMERPEHGEWRDSASGAHDPDCTDRRCGHRCGALYADQRRGAVRAAGGQYCGFTSSGIGGDRYRSRALGSGDRVHGHGPVDAGRAEWNDHERRAHTLRHGARWIFLQGHGGGASPLPYSFGRAHRATGVVDRAAVVRGKLSRSCFR